MVGKFSSHVEFKYLFGTFGLANSFIIFRSSVRTGEEHFTSSLGLRLLTYLCGTTTNSWLRPVEEDLSMSACLEHSVSNI
jgi:hypothetical protein